MWRRHHTEAEEEPRDHSKPEREADENDEPYTRKSTLNPMKSNKRTKKTARPHAENAWSNEIRWNRTTRSDTTPMKKKNRWLMQERMIDMMTADTTRTSDTSSHSKYIATKHAAPFASWWMSASFKTTNSAKIFFCSLNYLIVPLTSTI